MLIGFALSSLRIIRITLGAVLFWWLIKSFRLLNQSQAASCITDGGCSKSIMAERAVFTQGYALTALSLLQLILALELSRQLAVSQAVMLLSLLLAFEWLYYLLLAVILKIKQSIIPELLMFFLVTNGLTVSALYGGNEQMAETFFFVLLGLIAFGLTRLVLWLCKRVFWRFLLQTAAAAMILLLVLVNVVCGENVNGSLNWVFLGPFSFQPVEFIKPLLIFTIAVPDSENQDKTALHRLLLCGTAVILLSVYINDFGGLLLFGFVLGTMYWLRDGDIIIAAAAIALAAFLAKLLYRLSERVAARITFFFQCFEDYYNTGYQQVIGLGALAGGGLLGCGLGNSSITDLFAAGTDMVFAYYGEQVGLLYLLLLLAAYFLLACQAYCSWNSRDRFSGMLMIGAVMLLILQTILNVFGSSGVIFFTGVTLPFVSVGGSSLLSCFVLLAFVSDDISREDKEEVKAYAD